jgi:hypothetical protein
MREELAVATILVAQGMTEIRRIEPARVSCGEPVTSGRPLTFIV